MSPKFVLAWITSSNAKYHRLGQGGKVIFVKHPIRGWEMPGGHLHDGESPEAGLFREIFEETGLKCRLVGWNKEYYQQGWVAHVVSEPDFCVESWQTDDKNVEEVKLWSIIPPVTTWTKQEFIDIDDWCSQLYQCQN